MLRWTELVLLEPVIVSCAAVSPIKEPKLCSSKFRNSATAAPVVSITYRIAAGPQAGRKVFTLQTLPAYDVEEPFSGAADQVTGFSLHAGVAARATFDLNSGKWFLRFLLISCIPLFK